MPYPTPSPDLLAGGYWPCPACGDLNLPDAGMCQRCGEEKPQRVERAPEQEGAAA